METKRFYRVANTETNQGLWYDINGNFTGLIHDKFTFCLNTKLPMPYDENIIGYLSTTDKLEDLFNWFTKDDIIKLEEYGYYISIFESNDYKVYENHWVIKQDSAKLVERILITPPLNGSESPVDLDFAKQLKAEGYWRPTEYFYQDIDLPHCKKGLKKTKNGLKINHNNFDVFIYSAPSRREGFDYILGKKMQYESSMVIHLCGKEINNKL